MSEKENRRRVWPVAVTLSGLLMLAISQICFTGAQLAVDCEHTISEGLQEFGLAVFFVLIMYAMAITVIVRTAKDDRKS